MASAVKKHRGRIENLKPWKPGQSGNPSGYSAKRRIADRLCEILSRKAKDGGTVEQQMCEAQVIEALNGSVQHFTAIADRVDGKPRISIEHTGADGGPISVIHAELDQRIAELLDRGEARASAPGRESGTAAASREAGPAESAERTS